MCLYFVMHGWDSGDADGRIPVIGTRYCIEALGLPLKSSWRSWYHDNQVAPQFSTSTLHSVFTLKKKIEKKENRCGEK